MKLRSIVLAGLIGTSLLTMSGCNVDDVIDDLVQPNAVYAVNGYGVPITVYADNESGLVNYKATRVFSLTDSDYTDVYYKVGNNESTHASLPYGNAHLYVASSTCNLQNGFGSVTDVSTGRGVVSVVNATTSRLTADATHRITVHVTKNGTTTDHVLILQSGTTVAGCGKSATTINIANLGIENGSYVSVTIGSTTSSSYHVDFDIPTTVDVDIVYLGGENAVAVPLAKWDDLV